MNPENDDPPFKIPKVDLSLEMDTLHVGVTTTQFQNVLNLGDAMNRLKLGAPYRKFRPFNLRKIFFKRNTCDLLVNLCL